MSKVRPSVAPPPPPAASVGFAHRPVLVDAVVRHVPAGARLLVDATLGGGGHAEALLTAYPGAELFGADRDPAAVAAAEARLAPHAGRILLKHAAFTELPHHLAVGSVDFLLADLGVSSPQLDQAARGFSFTRDGPLDMRMDPQHSRRNAADLVNGLDADRLRDLLFRLGEERFAPRIVKAIVAARELAPIATTGALARIVAEAVPRRFHGPHHPATRTFQALRMEVNGELEQLDALLAAAPRLLATGGRLAVIAFHSLEDRAVKTALRGWAADCTCPPHTPVCVCGKVSLGRVLTRKPITATAEAVADNPRARSAKLRVFERGDAPMAEGRP